MVDHSSHTYRLPDLVRRWLLPCSTEDKERTTPDGVSRGVCFPFSFGLSKLLSIQGLKS